MFSLVQNHGKNLVEFSGHVASHTHTHTLQETEKDSSITAKEAQRKCAGAF